MVIKPLFKYYKNGSSFDIKAASLYSVALHADQNSYTIGISNPKTGLLVGLEKYEVHTIQELESDSFFDSEYIKNILSHASQTTLYSTTSKFTLIPSLFFDQNKIDKLHLNVFELNTDESIQSRFIPEIDSYILFPIKSALKSKLQTKIGHIDFHHHFASLISTYHLYYATENDNSAFIQMHSNSFSLCLFEGKKMILFNSFDFKTPEDIIYYTYYSIEQFNFSPAETLIHIGGSYDRKPEVISTLQRFSSKIFNLKPDELKQTNDQTSDALINTIFDLQCG